MKAGGRSTAKEDWCTVWLKEHIHTLTAHGWHLIKMVM